MKHRKQQKPHPDEYHFMNETIKKRPFDMRRFRRAFFTVAGCALILGAGFSAIHWEDWMEKRQEKELAAEEEAANGSQAETSENSEQKVPNIREVLVKVPDNTGQEGESGGTVKEFWDENAIIFLNNEADLYILTTESGLPEGRQVQITMADGPVMEGYTEGLDEETGRRMIQVPLETMLPDIAEVVSHREKFRYLGIFGTDISEARVQTRKLPQGVYVDRVENQSPAMRAGIQSGDVLKTLDGAEMGDVEAYREKLQSLKTGDEVQAVLSRRNGQGEYEEISLSMIVEEK